MNTRKPNRTAFKSDEDIALEGALDCIKREIDVLFDINDTIAKLKNFRKNEKNPSYDEHQVLKLIRYDHSGNFGSHGDVMEEVEAPLSVHVIQTVIEELVKERDATIAYLRDDWGLPIDDMVVKNQDIINKTNEESSS